MSAGALSRRGFLYRLGAIGGYSAVYGAMGVLGLLHGPRAFAGVPGLAPGSGAGKSVVILGAGIAGLVSAYELSKAGYRVTVLEARDRVGGRVWTVRGGDHVAQIGRPDQHCDFDAGLYFNAGAGRIPTHHHAMLHYVRELGVPIEVMVNVNRSAGTDFTGVVSNRQAINDQRGRIAELLAKAIDKGALDAELTGADKARLRGWLRGWGALARDGAYKGSDRAGYADLPGGYDDPGKLLEPLTLPQLQSHAMFGVGPIFEEIFDQQAPMFQPVGGMDRIADALYRKVEKDVRLGSPVKGIARRGAGVRVRLASGANVDADYCLCTLPANQAARLQAPFSKAKRAALAKLAYSPGTKVAWQAPRFWEAEGVYGGLAWTSAPSEVVWYPSGGWNAEQGVLVGAYSVGFNGEDGSRAFAAMSAAERIATASAVIERLHPGKAALLTRPVTVSWSQTQWSEGVGAEWEERGADYAELCRAEGPVFFAGEHLSYLPYWQEGAALSAHAAIAALHRVAVG